MPFIKFSEHGRSYAARASISKTGMMSLNDGARKRFGLDNYKYCVLYFDPDTNRVGIELTTDGETEGARKIRFRTTGADIAAKSFVDYFNLGIKETMLYTPTIDADTGYLTIDLNSGTKRTRHRKVEASND